MANRSSFVVTASAITSVFAVGAGLLFAINESYDAQPSVYLAQVTGTGSAYCGNAICEEGERVYGRLMNGLNHISQNHPDEYNALLQTHFDLNNSGSLDSEDIQQILGLINDFNNPYGPMYDMSNIQAYEHYDALVGLIMMTYNAGVAHYSPYIDFQQPYEEGYGEFSFLDLQEIIAGFNDARMCTADCGNLLTSCGNGVVDQNEHCDDGNTVNGDGCDAICQLEFEPQAPPPAPGPVARHLECINSSCIPVDGEGENECETDDDCTVGSLFVTKGLTPVPSQQLLGGTLSDPVLILNFRAEEEDIDVTDLQLASLDSNASSVDRLELYRPGEQDYFALATIGGCKSDQVPAPGRTFCADMHELELVIPEGNEVDVLVRARMKDDISGGVSDEPLRLYIDPTAVADEATGSGAVRARGVQSSNNLLPNDGNNSAEEEIFIGNSTPAANQAIISQQHVSALAKITSIVNANPDANFSPVPLGVSPIGQFEFSAAAHNNSNSGDNDAVLSGVIFTINASNVALRGNEFKFYNKADSTTLQSCTPFDERGSNLSTGIASGVVLVVCEMLETSNVNTEIDEGSSQTFVLQADVIGGAYSGTASLVVGLDSIGSDQIDAPFARWASHIQWIDNDAWIGSNTTEVFNWTEIEDAINSTYYYSVFEIAVCGNSIVEEDEECDDGNNVDTDDCSNTCLQPYISYIHDTSLPETSDTSDEVQTALRFTIRNNTDSDMLFTTLGFQTVAGDVMAPGPTSFYVDRNGDGTTETLLFLSVFNVPDPNGNVTVLSGFDETIEPQSEKVFEVQGTFESEMQVHTKFLEFMYGYAQLVNRYEQVANTLCTKRLGTCEISGEFLPGVHFVE